MDDRQSARLAYWPNDCPPHVSLGTQEMTIWASQNYILWALASRARPAVLQVLKSTTRGYDAMLLGEGHKINRSHSAQHRGAIMSNISTAKLL